jgi:hypothetical protein
MNCTQIEKLIPLYIGGDLKTQETSELCAHLAECAQCRNLAAEFEESRSWLIDFTSPPFDEGVFDELRRAAQIEIVQARFRPSVFGWLESILSPRIAAAASISVLVLLAAVGTYIYRRQAIDQPKVAIGGDDKVAPIPSPRSGRQNITPGGVKQNLGNVAAVKPSLRIGRQKKALRQNESAPKQETIAINAGLPAQSIIFDESKESPEMTRIEFQTTDPNIKIIWLTPKDSNSSASQSDSIHK